MDDESAIAAFSALAQADRLSIVKALVTAGPGGLSAGEIARGVGASPSRASFHLSALAEAGLVTAERAARTITYRASFTQLGALVAYMLEDCCKSHPSVRAYFDPPAAERIKVSQPPPFD